MNQEFYKYQGTGNDFIMIDNREGLFPKDNIALIAHLCHRRLGIGADGLILIENETDHDFRMVYYNADGSCDTMCGNGGRCAVAFAKALGIIENKTTFTAVGHVYEASIDPENVVSLHMMDVSQLENRKDSVFLNTGSPHHVQLVDDLEEMDVNQEGAKLRYGLYGQTGSNINFVHQEDPSTFKVRTYERGVEAETLSCGTGVCAVALAMHHKGHTQAQDITINTKGGQLGVRFQYQDDTYSQVYLSGPTVQVFKGQIPC
ncbi:diaminopimelate epimerase [Sediminicola luteus]|uniref:Diaminopimelate epimerase n=1 Tax=Sediminicola luteus TaxID=319238 RepID=A0A2A4G6N4_9FLAO|nr:diaminopimelate epimerase [Sediminicola luteus]PCE63648.1 diaminopimelate epimerase [Sediminicola luteus]